MGTTMNNQSEPDDGVWQDCNGDFWRKGKRSGTAWVRINDNLWRFWDEVRDHFAPLVPLIPDPGWEQEGEPVVLHLTTDEIEIMAKRSNTDDANSIRYKLERVCRDLSPGPEPSLVDQLRGDAANQEDHANTLTPPCIVCSYHQGWADAEAHAAGDVVERLLTAIEAAAAEAVQIRGVLNR